MTQELKNEGGHTPGPFTVSPADPRVILHRGRDAGRAYLGAPFITQAQAEATARLWAAAPDLLEALREVVAISDRKTDAWDRAKAAIAKAEGRPHD